MSNRKSYLAVVELGVDNDKFDNDVEGHLLTEAGISDEMASWLGDVGFDVRARVFEVINGDI
jgi:hypothetical protein